MCEQSSDSLQFGGENWSLSRETRWARIFVAPDGKKQFRRSRFLDGSAAITLNQLAIEWDAWTLDEKREFCDAAEHLPAPLRASILRFLIIHAGQDLLHNTALTIARSLESAEAVPWLVQAITQSAPGKATAFVQALAQTRSAEAIEVIETRLQETWKAPTLFKDDPFVNWVAFEAAHCIRYLINLGCSATNYEEKARQLSRHQCKRVREAYEWYLSPHFDTNE